MLTLKEIDKFFSKKQVLFGVNLDVKKNSVVGLLGPNGAGKTTLMRIIVGFFGCNQGKITWQGKRIDPRNKSFQSKIGYLPENNPLYLNLSTAEYLKFIARLKGIAKGESETEIKKTALECGLNSVMGQKLETLSKGYKQRVGLAAALIGNPEILILDEPTSGLDPNQIIEIRDLIKKLAKKKMILLSTHILPEAKEVCDRIVIISQGRIVLDEETKSVKNLEKKFVSLTA